MSLLWKLVKEKNNRTMADMGEGGGGHEKGGKKRAKKGSTRVDMTPLVDLAFLLLTFFVMTSTFSKPKVMSLIYPAKIDKDVPPPKETKINHAITFLLSENRLFYYEGEYYAVGNPKGKPATQLSETNFGPTGLRKLLTDKNNYVLLNVKKYDAQFAKGMITDKEHTDLIKKAKENTEALKVLIKTDNEALCKNFIDVIDELRIAQVGMMAPVDLMRSEDELIKAKLK